MPAGANVVLNKGETARTCVSTLKIHLNETNQRADTSVLLKHNVIEAFETLDHSKQTLNDKEQEKMHCLQLYQNYINE